jgi:hypothetical protein
VHAVDRVAVELELAGDGGRERDPRGAQLGERDRLPGRLAQPTEQALLLTIERHHKNLLAPPHRRRARDDCG